MSRMSFFGIYLVKMQLKADYEYYIFHRTTTASRSMPSFGFPLIPLKSPGKILRKHRGFPVIALQALVKGTPSLKESVMY